jgi:hypothetical protein
MMLVRIRKIGWIINIIINFKIICKMIMSSKLVILKVKLMILEKLVDINFNILVIDRYKDFAKKI